jgi:asparagine synthetase B (glutamine-hydrolysing)
MFAESGGRAITMASRLGLSPDERYARYAGRRISCPLEGVYIRPSSLADDVSWSLSLQDEPMGMISFFMLAQLVRAAKKHSRILLTGDGGDEVFLGYAKAGDWLAQPTRLFKDDEDSWTVGVAPPPWMSPWGCFVVKDQLLGHMLPKVDRAAAEQGVETRSPLLDWDLLSFARSVPPEQLLAKNQMKALLKAQLDGWPGWFLERSKVGFTFHLRWLWLVSGFAGLRELVSSAAITMLGEAVPPALRCAPQQWATSVIFSHFGAVWKLLALSAFLQRFAAASHHKPVLHRNDSLAASFRLDTHSQRFGA